MSPRSLGILFSGGAGMLTGLSIILPAVWLLVFIAPAPFVMVLLNPRIVPSRLRALTIGVVFGTALNGVVSLSAWSLYPLDWIGIPYTLVAFLIIGASWAGLALLMSASTALFALLVFQMRERLSNPGLIVLTIAVAWVLIEPLRAVLFSLFMLGPTSSFHIAYTIGSLGYAFGNAGSEFWISLARWGGIPALSFFAMAISASIALLYTSSQTRKTALYRVLFFGVALMFLALSGAAHSTATTEQNSAGPWGDTEILTVVAVHTQFPALFAPSNEELRVRTRIVYGIARELAATGIEPDILLLPEGIGMGLDTDEYSEIDALLPPGTLIIHGKYDRREAGPAIVQTHAHTVSGLTAVTDKQFVFPYGEYPPYHLLLPLRVLNPSLYDALRGAREYRGGTETALGTAAGVAVGVRMCSEIFAPSLYKKLVQEHDAGILTHVSSVAMFHDSAILHHTVRAAARLRAVESGLPLVQATNGGRGTAFDCRGREMFPVSTHQYFHVYEVGTQHACIGDI